MNNKCYVIENKYTGPNQNQDQYIDADTIVISSEPATTNSSGEVRLSGWCGTTNDWAVYAHGEFDTLDQARQAIVDTFGECRETESTDNYDESIIETYKPGKYAPMSVQATGDLSYDAINEDIDADTSDEQMEKLVQEYEEYANSNGATLDQDAVLEMMQDKRQELLDEIEADKD